MTTQSDNKNLIERLFSAGSHFAFSKSRRHPSVAPYIFGNKQGTDIINLEKSVETIETAKAVLQQLGENGKTVLFVGTKEEIAKLVHSAAVAAGMPYVTNRWIGGMMTNFSEIKKRIERMKQLKEEQASGALERKYVKRERVVIGREVDKLTFNFGGIETLERRPDALVVVDPRHDTIAVQEATDLNIPVIAIAGSDCDLTRVKYPVVLNDSLTASVTLALRELSEAFIAGRANQVVKPVAKPTAPRSAHRPAPRANA